MAAAHAFVDDLDRPELDADDRHHLERVLRLKPDEAVTVSDGLGGLRRCRFARGGELVAESEVERVPAPEPLVSVAFALAKGDRPEWVVQKLTEVGVDSIVPFFASRSIVRWDDERRGRQAERFRRVARDAAMQSRRVWLPDVGDVVSFAEAAAGSSAIAERGGRPPSLGAPAVMVGPEGGWDESELAIGLALVGLGPTVLRSETAAMAAGLVLCALRAGTVCPS